MTVTSWATLIRKNKNISRILNCTNVKKFSKTIGNTFNKYNRGFRTLKLGPLKKKSGLVLFPILTYDWRPNHQRTVKQVVSHPPLYGAL